MTKPKNSVPKRDELSPLELMRIVPLVEAARLSAVSEKTLRRNHADKIRRMSPGRVGMRLGDVLAIGQSQGATEQSSKEENDNGKDEKKDRTDQR